MLSLCSVTAHHAAQLEDFPNLEYTWLHHVYLPEHGVPYGISYPHGADIQDTICARTVCRLLDIAFLFFDMAQLPYFPLGTICHAEDSFLTTIKT